MSSNEQAALLQSRFSSLNQNIVFFGALAGLSFCLYTWLWPRESEEHDFDGFLKQVPPKKDQFSINNFLKADQSSFQTRNQLWQEQQPSQQESAFEHLEQVRVVVLFGTEFGFSQEIAEHTAKLLVEAGYWPVVRNMAFFWESYDFSSEQLVLIICSTQGDGVPPSEARPFCQWLNSTTINLGHLKYCVLALGDRGYPHFCNCGKMLDARFCALGGQRLYERVDVNQEDWGAIDGWIAGILEQLQNFQFLTVEEMGPELYEDANAFVKPKPGTKMAPLRGTVVEVSNLCQKPRDQDPKITVMTKISTGDTVLPYNPGDALGVYPSNDPLAVENVLSLVTCDPSHPVPIPTCHHLSRTTPTSPLREALLHFYDLRTPRDTLLTWLQESQLPTPTRTGKPIPVVCACGAKSLKVEKVNGVGQTSQACTCGGDSVRANGKPEVMVCDCGAQTFQVVAYAKGGVNRGREHVGKPATTHVEEQQGYRTDKGQSDPDGAPVHGNVQRNVQRNVNDSGSAVLSRPPQIETAVCDCGAETFTFVVASQENGVSNSVTSQPTDPRLLTNVSDVAAYLQQRHVVDVLQDFTRQQVNGKSSELARKVSISAADLVRHLRPLQPRLYSISSSPLEDPYSVQVTVAIVRYTCLNLPRIGVASTYLGERVAPGDLAHVYLSVNPEFRLPSKSQTPIIMIGPGTGIAPFRAFVIDRIFTKQRGEQIGRMLLFFGCRRRDEDYVYQEEMEGWERDGVVELHTAFSREQAYKVYVQDKLREAAEKVVEVVREGGHVYVCGDAQYMAPQVEEVLGGILVDGGVGKGTTGLERMQWLTQQGRYAKDVWQ